LAEEITQFAGETRYRYDWDRWTNGSWWKLFRGLDFGVEPDKLRNRMYQKGNRLDPPLKARTHKQVERIDQQSDDAQARLRERGVGGPEIEVVYVRFFDPSVEAEAAA
jgi:hypothetical protein